MKSHWKFLRTGWMPVSSWLFHSTNKHTWISTIILYTNLSPVCPIEHCQLKLALVPWNTSEQLLFYRDLYPEGLSVEDWPKPLLCREAAPTSLPIMPMSALRIFPDPGDNNELIFITIPSWVAVHSSQPYACFRYMGVTSEKRSIFKFSLLQICTFFPLNSVRGHIVRGRQVKSSRGS